MAQEKDLSGIDDVIALIAPIISHEVRNPLAIIGNSSYFIKTKLGNEGKVDPKVERHLAIIEMELRHANDVFIKIIGYARMLEAQRSPVSLASLVRDAAADFSGLKTDIPANVKVSADAELAKASLRALIENAVQAVGDGESLDAQGRVMVKAAVKKGRAIVDVIDSGPGVPPEALPRLFLPFNTTKPRGIGMALAYAKKALGRQDGTIEYVPSQKGAHFRITLPLSD